MLFFYGNVIATFDLFITTRSYIVHFAIMYKFTTHYYPGYWDNNIPVIFLSFMERIQPPPPLTLHFQSLKRCKFNIYMY